MDIWMLLLAGTIVLGGAVVQGSVGFGMNLIAAPLLAIADPVLVPVPLLVTASAFAVLPLVRERGQADWRGVRWALVGRVPGTVLGVAALALLPSRWLAVLIGVVVLVSVGLSLLTWRPRPVPSTLFTAGVFSGVFGTAAAVGGPPMALVYQHNTGPTVRSTLSAYFALGSLLSLGALLLSGQVQPQQLLAAAVLFPFAMLGFVLSGPLRRPLDRGGTRPALLGLAAFSALSLLFKALG
ncbi:sulfite exporter TauE/SafE family protein [Actinopolyspora mortivallis]|uniref:sulfite exporter TauE/SafE family protein n=1 Tax=Actinopolyspora mortivallis TaxID=33906 RepID=UPI00035FA86F|nr:TSUP family transporter [Actinopolyspora mortivallis]